MVDESSPKWRFLTNHAQVFVCVARDPGVRLREISERVGITERASHRIVTDLADAGYITRERNGRRNRYTVQSNPLLRDHLVRLEDVGDLLTILAEEMVGPADPPAEAPPKKKAGVRA